MENKVCLDRMGKTYFEFRIDKYDNLQTFFEKIIEAAKYHIILGDKFLINYNIVLKDIRNEDLKKLCRIASNFPLKRPFMELIDDLLFYILYRREILLLRDLEKAKKIKELSEVLSEFSNYREKIIDGKLEKSLERNELYSRLYDGINRLVVLLTHSCQLRCKYCRVRKFGANMNEDILIKAIKLLFTSDKKDLQLQFFGGEPLLKFNLIKRAVDYAESLGRKTKKNLQLILTTNGIELTEDKLSYLKKHNFLIEFSFDGDIETQLKTRKSKSGKNYYSVVEKNLSKLLESNIPHYTITVVTPETVSELYNNFIYLVKKGYKRMQINYSLGFYWNPKATNELIVQLNKITSFIKRNKKLGIKLINTQRTRREPVVLNAELTVDCDGTIYLETGICLEEDFLKMKDNFKVVNVLDAKNINFYSTTKFNNFYRLVKVYAEKYPEFRKIIINNIELGNFLNKFLKKEERNEYEN